MPMKDRVGNAIIDGAELAVCDSLVWLEKAKTWDRETGKWIPLGHVLVGYIPDKPKSKQRTIVWEGDSFDFYGISYHGDPE